METRKKRSIPKIISDEQFEENVKAHDVVCLFLYFVELNKHMIEENVILVNEQDEQIGLMPKLEAHEKAVLHRAFSVFYFK
jgi:hypothetical protein